MIGGERSPQVDGLNSGQLSSVSCPNGQFMASCSGYAYWRNTNSWWIGTDDICYSRTAEYDTSDNYYTQASAIWYVQIPPDLCYIQWKSQRRT